MKYFFFNTVAVVFTSLLLAGCGGSSSPTYVPKTQGSVALFLFGSMSSASKVASIETRFKVPDGIMVNYSSPPGITTGIHPIRSGSFVLSGSSLFSKNDITTTYDTSPDKRELRIFIMNNQMKDIKSNITANGLEIATLSFKLEAPDVIPTLSTPWQDPAVVVWQDTTTLVYPFTESAIKTGLKLNFISSFQ